MKVCLQAGHVGLTSGATGAPGEMAWNAEIVVSIADKLKSAGVTTYITDALGNTDETVTSTDWDMFLAVHYDADIYNDRGGFVDFPDPTADKVWARSKQLAESLGDHYFKITGIPEKPSRSNANTKFYYMWSALTESTPCVLIECGIGWRKPEDYEVLRQFDFIADAISTGILKGLGIYNECEENILKLEEELTDMRDSRNKWRDSYKNLEELYLKDKESFDQVSSDLYNKIEDSKKTIEELRKTIANNKTPITDYSLKEIVLGLLKKIGR